MFVWQKKEWFGFLQVQSNLQKRPPLYNGHLSRTSVQRKYCPIARG